jgi:hypothetical protein
VASSARPVNRKGEAAVEGRGWRDAVTRRRGDTGKAESVLMAEAEPFPLTERLVRRKGEAVVEGRGPSGETLKIFKTFRVFW